MQFSSFSRRPLDCQLDEIVRGDNAYYQLSRKLPLQNYVLEKQLVQRKSKEDDL